MPQVPASESHNGTILRALPRSSALFLPRLPTPSGPWRQMRQVRRRLREIRGHAGFPSSSGSRAEARTGAGSCFAGPADSFDSFDGRAFASEVFLHAIPALARAPHSEQPRACVPTRRNETRAFVTPAPAGAMSPEQPGFLSRGNEGSSTGENTMTLRRTAIPGTPRFCISPILSVTY